MNELVLHCGAQAATRERVCAVPTPEYTETWHPVGYGQLLDHISDRLAGAGLKVTGEAYGLNRNDNQLFGVMHLDVGSDESGLMLGFRQSLDQSLSLAFALGVTVFVCDNYAFSGRQCWVVKKNTKRVWDHFTRQFSDNLANASHFYERLADQLARWKTIEVPERDGYELLGAMYGAQRLTPTQAAVAFREWREPSHEEFADRNAYCLYQAVTEALKKGAAGTTIDRQIAAHGFFQATLDGVEDEAVEGLEVEVVE